MKKSALFLAIMMVLAMFAGCQETGGTGTSSGEKSDTVTIATQQDFVALDPFNTTATPDFNANWCIFDSLLNMDINGNIQYLVAETHSVSDDGKEITFNIREGIKFHDGTEVKASDVVYSALLMKESSYKARVAVLYDTAEVVDEYTMKFILPQPAASFIYELAYNFAVYPEAYHKEKGEAFKDNPIGCGAYKFVSKKSGEGVVLEVFDDYYGDAPAIKNIHFRVIPDASTALVSLENGEIDLCQYVPASSYPLVESNDDLRLLQTQYSRVLNLILNTAKEPFVNNPTLRQALAHAVDKQALVDVSLEGYGSVAVTLVNETFIGAPKSMDAYDRKYDVEKAKELLKEAGYENGEGLPVLKLTTIDMFKKQSEQLQAMFKEIGITMEIDMVELSTYISMSSNAEFQMGLMSTNQGGDASVFAALLLSSTSNGASYGNPVVDELFNKASAELDNDKRADIFEELYSVVLDDMPYISIYFPDTVSCGKTNLDFDTIMDYVAYKGMYYSYK